MNVCFQQLNLLTLSVLTDSSVTEYTDLYDREFKSGFVLIYNKETICSINQIDINLAKLDSAGWCATVTLGLYC